MKHFKLAVIVFGLVLYGCNQTESKEAATDPKAKREKTDAAPQLSESETTGIENLIALFKVKNIEKISDNIRYPLKREYPLPAIKNKAEFKQRFDEVFDKVLIDKIANSKPEQWSEVGWRGIMLDQGIVWVADASGMITAVNYQSDFEKKRKEELIAEDGENLHASLKIFESPTYKIKTKKYLIRIDQLANDRYRYASWKIGEKESAKPDIVLNNGELQFEGSGGNHTITFVNGVYSYKIYRNILGEKGSPDVTLEIEKDGEIISASDGTLILN